MRRRPSYQRHDRDSSLPFIAVPVVTAVKLFKGQRRRAERKQWDRREAIYEAAARGMLPGAPNPGGMPGVGVVSVRDAITPTQIGTRSFTDEAKAQAFRRRKILEPLAAGGLLLFDKLIAAVSANTAVVLFIILAVSGGVWWLRVRPIWSRNRPIPILTGRSIAFSAIMPALTVARNFLAAPRGAATTGIAAALAWLWLPLPRGPMFGIIAAGTIAATIARARHFRIREVEESTCDHPIAGDWSQHLSWRQGDLLGSYIHENVTPLSGGGVTFRVAVAGHATDIVSSARAAKTIERFLPGPEGPDGERIPLPVGSVTVKGTGRADLISVTISPQKTLQNEFVKLPYEAPDKDGWLRVGRADDASWALCRYWDDSGMIHWVVTGGPRTGKSAFMRRVVPPMAEIACVLYLDGKRGVSAPVFAPIMHAFCRKEEQWRAAIFWAWLVLCDREDRRGDRGAAGELGVDTWTMGQEDEPAYIIVVDEMATVNEALEHRCEDPRAAGRTYAKMWMEIASRGPGVGFALCAINQDAMSEFWPGGRAGRGMLGSNGNTVTFRATDDTSGRIAARRTGEIDASQIPSVQGACLITVRDEPPRTWHRGIWVTTDECARDVFRLKSKLIEPSRENIAVAPDIYMTMRGLSGDQMVELLERYELSLPDPAEEGPAAAQYTEPTGPALNSNDQHLLEALAVGGPRRRGKLQQDLAGLMSAKTVSNRLHALRHTAPPFVVQYKPPGEQYPLFGITAAGRDAIGAEPVAEADPQDLGDADDPDADPATGEPTEEDRRCPDCQVEPGVEHLDGCDWATCLQCGGQRLMCGPDGHAVGRDVWTGMDHAERAAREFGWFTQDRCAEGLGFVPCEETAPGARPDLSRVHVEAEWNTAVSPPVWVLPTRRRQVGADVGKVYRALQGRGCRHIGEIIVATQMEPMEVGYALDELLRAGVVSNPSLGWFTLQDA
jgi:hypothetical protein